MDKQEAQLTAEDLTGKNRMFWNTFISWSSHMVLVISGFIMPRLMDQKLGQAELGSWDLCWTFISYISLVGLGIGSSSNRYVAKYRAEHNRRALNRLVSSVVSIQIFIAAAIFSVTLAIVYSLPFYFSEKLGDHVASIQSITLYLGISLAVTELFSASRGLLTGYHRWDLHNGLTAMYSLFSVVFMMLMLFSGYGIEGMAKAYLVNTIIFELIRIWVTSKYCSGLSLAFSLATKKQCLELFSFCFKNKLLLLPRIIVLQSVNFMVVSAMGLTMLAVFSRSLALTRHISTFMSKFTMLITPSASSMLADSQKKELEDFFLTTTRLSFAFTLPLVISLAVLGDLILLFWMGPNYVNHPLIIVLALGVLLPASQDCSLRFLMGMNQHGKISVYLLFVVLAVFAGFYGYYLVYGFTLVSAALSFTVPMNLAYGIILPIYTSRKLKLSFSKYLIHAIFRPMVAVLPFSALLFLARYSYQQNEITLSVAYLLVAIASLFACYSVLILTHIHRQKMVNKVTQFIRVKNLKRTCNFMIRMLFYLGLGRVVRHVNRHKITIVTMHGVMSYHDRILWQPLRRQLDPEVLERTIQILSKYYTFISLARAKKILLGISPPVQNGLVFTLDDGYWNNLVYAGRIFKKYGIKPTIFVATKNIEECSPFWFDRLDYALQQLTEEYFSVRLASQQFVFDTSSRDGLKKSYAAFRAECKNIFATDDEMRENLDRISEQIELKTGKALTDIIKQDDWTRLASWQELITASKSGEFDVGSHTIDHIRIAFIDTDEAIHQLTGSKKQIESTLGKACLHFCYPNGDVNDITATLVAEAGYELAVTTAVGVNAAGDNMMRLKRFSIPMQKKSNDVLYAISPFRIS